MKRDAEVFLAHILESIKKIEEFTKGISKEKFFRDIKLQDAVIRRIEIIGEAAKNLPANFREKHSDIEWAEMAKTRDKLIHGYFGVDIELTWNIVKDNLPNLKEKIKNALKQMQARE